jgi:hypothetical protein
VTNATDCNDSNAAISPGDPEICDASDTDEDCDGVADDADTSATGETTWYADADGDGYGDSSTTQALCNQPSGYVTSATDCDDSANDAYPGGTEVCDDGIDQDCSGADEECPSTSYTGTYAVNTDYDTKIYGVTSGDRFGAQMVAGDFNGDGVGDLVVSATYNIYSTEESTVYGYYGPFTRRRWHG